MSPDEKFAAYRKAQERDLKYQAVEVFSKRSTIEENDGEGLVNRTSAPKAYGSIMRSVVTFLESLGFTVNPEECSWKSITAINGYFQLDVLLVNPKTTAAVTSTKESVDRHQLALDDYARTGKWVEPSLSASTPAAALNQQRTLGVRQTRELSTYTNVVSLSSAIKTEYAFQVSAIHKSGIACTPIYGEVTPETDLAEAVKNAIKLMLYREPRAAIGWSTPPPEDKPDLATSTVTPPPAAVEPVINFDI